MLVTVTPVIRCKS